MINLQDIKNMDGTYKCGINGCSNRGLVLIGDRLVCGKCLSTFKLKQAEKEKEKRKMFFEQFEGIVNG